MISHLIIVLLGMSNMMLFNPKVEIVAKFDSCLHKSSGQLKFCINNGANENLWLNSWSLCYSLKIKDSKGNEIFPKYLIEEIKPKIEQFVQIKSHSKLVLEIEMDFSRYPLDFGEKYFLEISYNNSIKKAKDRTVMGKIDIPKIEFQLCD